MWTKLPFLNFLPRRAAIQSFMTMAELFPYYNFYENVMKTLFHNFKSLYETDLTHLTHTEHEHLWSHYTKVNQLFARRIAELKTQLSRENEAPFKQVWIHGDNLLMLPLYIRKSSFSQEANIGFFFHSPFPSSGIFRMFQYRFELLQSLLQCDLIGFHLFEYARNFLMTCHRLLGLEYEFSRGGYLGINNHGKNVMVRVSHVGIDSAYFDHLFHTRQYQSYLSGIKKWLYDIRSQFDGPPIIVSSIDSLHPITGIKNKLLSYYQFLKKYRETYWRKIILV